MDLVDYYCCYSDDFQWGFLFLDHSSSHKQQIDCHYSAGVDFRIFFSWHWCCSRTWHCLIQHRCCRRFAAFHLHRLMKIWAHRLGWKIDLFSFWTHQRSFMICSLLVELNRNGCREDPCWNSYSIRRNRCLSCFMKHRFEIDSRSPF